LPTRFVGANKLAQTLVEKLTQRGAIRFTQVLEMKLTQ